MMSNWLSILLLSLVEGITEFLPISSTGHLILIESLIPLESLPSQTFHIVIQLGAIGAILVKEWPIFTSFLNPLSSKQNLHLLLACLPIMCLGILFNDFILYLFNPLSVSLALITGGILMLLLQYTHSKKDMCCESLDQITTKQALIIGITQSLALWPGFSRSAASIMGALYGGFSYHWAARYSFIVGFPVITSAALFSLSKQSHTLNLEQLTSLFLGVILSFVFSLLSIYLVLKLLKHFKLLPFAWYRIILGVGILILLY